MAALKVELKKNADAAQIMKFVEMIEGVEFVGPQPEKEPDGPDIGVWVDKCASSQTRMEDFLHSVRGVKKVELMNI